MASLDRRQRERAEMRSMIAQAAMKLFLGEGYDRTSMRRIAEAIDYTPGALYSYFEDKDEILRVLHDEAFEGLHARLLLADAERDPFSALVRTGELYLEYALENPLLYDLMFIEDTTGAQAVRSKDWRPGLRSYDVLRRRVYAAMAAGALPDANPEVVAFSLWANVHGLSALVIRHRCPMIPGDSLPNMVRAAYAASMKAWAEAGARTGGGQMLPPFVALADLPNTEPLPPPPLDPPATKRKPKARQPKTTTAKPRAKATAAEPPAPAAKPTAKPAAKPAAKQKARR